MRQNYLQFWATLLAVFSVFSALWVAIPRTSKPRLATRHKSPGFFPDVSAVSDREGFFEACGKIQKDDRRFEVCREKLHILSTSFLWVDSRYLLKQGESLSSKHLDTFYGLSGPGEESARLTIGSALITRCKKGASTNAATFEQLIDQNCLRHLPTLAELGLEEDPEWAGIQVVNTTYDGKLKPLHR
jgi:hypothetical protein